MIPLEDNVGDIIGKAQRGLRISDSELAEKAGVSRESLVTVRDGGKIENQVLEKIAPVLQLNAAALVDLSLGKWKPADIPEINGLAMFTTDYDGMAVNSYLAWDPDTKAAVAFDTGADCAPMLRRAKSLKIQMILLTHAHEDHVADLPRLREETRAQVYAPAKEPVAGAELIDEGKQMHTGKIEIDTRSTWGHSPGGVTYVLTGLDRPIAVVGDSIFAGSMGGGGVSYDDALKNNLEKILTLPNETIICPGHGPMTTVGEEKQHNPFFAGRI